MSNSNSGNANFTKVASDVHLSDTSVTNLNAHVVSTDLLNHSLAVPGLGTLHQVVGYAPTSFATGATNSVHYLNSVPQSAAATSASSSQLLVLPNPCTIVSMVLTNNGTTIAGGTTFDVGTEAWGAGTGNTDLGTAVPLATLNGTAGCRVGAVSSAALGSAGVINAGVAVTTNNSITVQVLAAPNTTGDLAALISYLA